MAESAEASPGRPRKELRGEIIEELETTDHRAMTLGMLTEEVDGARATVKDRLDTLIDEGVIDHQKIGNATAYWIPDDGVASDGGLMHRDAIFADYRLLKATRGRWWPVKLVSSAGLFVAAVVAGIVTLLSAASIVSLSWQWPAVAALAAVAIMLVLEKSLKQGVAGE